MEITEKFSRNTNHERKSGGAYGKERLEITGYKIDGVNLICFVNSLKVKAIADKSSERYLHNKYNFFRGFWELIAGRAFLFYLFSRRLRFYFSNDKEKF